MSNFPPIKLHKEKYYLLGRDSHGSNLDAKHELWPAPESGPIEVISCQVSFV